MSTHQDRARVNKVAIGNIFTTFPGAKPARNYCCTHTIRNTGKKAIGGEGSAIFYKIFRKACQAVINTPGKARDLYAELFGNAPTRAGGIRFFTKCEQIAELFEVTTENIMDFIVWCIEHSVSELSAKNMMQQFNPLTVARVSLAMAIF